MAEYIEREALYEKLHEAGGCDAPKESWADGYDKGITEAIKILNEAPAADVVEVVHGRWDKNHPDDNIFYCDQCYMPQDEPTKYCSSCGAKMDGKDDKDGK